MCFYDTLVVFVYFNYGLVIEFMVYILMEKEMNSLRQHKDLLTKELNNLFVNMAVVANKIKKEESDYAQTLERYIDSLEIIRNKDDFKIKLNAVVKMFGDWSENNSEVYTVTTELLKNYEDFISIYEKMEPDLLFSAIKNIKDSSKKVRHIINELNFLFQYDDIVTQSFLSYNEVLNFIDDVFAGKVVLSRIQAVKLKILFSTIVVNIFEMIDDTLSLIDSKLFKIASIFRSTRSYISSVLTTVKHENMEFFLKVATFKDLHIKHDKNEADDFLVALDKLKIIADWEFFEKIYKNLYKTVKDVQLVNYEINMILNKTVMDKVVLAIDSLFNELLELTKEDCDNIDFVDLFSEKFKIKEHKQLLFDIFKEADNKEENPFGDDFELF